MGLEVFLLKEPKAPALPAKHLPDSQVWMPAGKWLCCSEKWRRSGGICELAARIDCQATGQHFHPPVPEHLVFFGDNTELFNWVHQNVQAFNYRGSAKVLLERRHLAYMVQTLPDVTLVDNWGPALLNAFDFEHDELYFVALGYPVNGIKR